MDRAGYSLNSVTVRDAPFTELLELATTHGFGGVGLWRDAYRGIAPATAARAVADAGLRVSSICRGGMFPQPTAGLRQRRHDDNRDAVDEAHAFGADCLVLVCGPAVNGDLAGARQQIADGIAELAPYAAAAGVGLAVEPMHPMMAADRSAITSLAEAVDLVSTFRDSPQPDPHLSDPAVGLAVDSYHVWWDAALDDQMLRAAGSVMSLQIADWVVPIEGQLSSRGMPGEGCIDLVGFIDLAHTHGYRGLIEVEVLSDRWWAAGPIPAAAAAAAGIDTSAGIDT